MCARITLMSNEFTLAPESFHESFCADIAPDDAAFYAISRPPLAGLALTEPGADPGVARPPGLE